MLTLRSIVFTFTLLIIFYINGASNVQAQAMRLTSLSETGSINGETIYSIADIGFELRAVPATNNQGGTWSWTISGGYALLEGTTTSRNIRVKWTTPGSYTVSVTYSGPQGATSAMLTVVVRTAAQSTDLSALPCSREGSISSSGSTYPTQILFSNTINKTVKLFWLDYSGHDIGDNNNNVPFSQNIENQDVLDLFDAYFNEQLNHNKTDFWAVYVLGGYQYTTDRDGDPRNFLPNGSIRTVYGIADVPERARTGQGAILFTEDGRSNEYPPNSSDPPISPAYTVAHEIGHLFGCIHADGGLMTESAIRTSGNFTAECLYQIRTVPNP